ncbi:protein phosphatase inhibitor 2 [Ancylostoma ceylanicum]|uniref:Protein phosphatase inhibitor 2 n=1 Tax=Ancylostoma ceylanicum TaxID=53326 RepID=A0A0D6LL52_9BILA|nr:protein phosphatase inhibitor 2 [Ancylostoma ceylanicum]
MNIQQFAENICAPTFEEKLCLIIVKMTDFPCANVDEHLTPDGKIRVVDDPTEYLKRQPKKSILKMKQDVSMDGKEGRAHFDEMNILATYHPTDKDYGTMKIDEPKTPYNYSDCESEGDETSSGQGSRHRRVSLGGAIDPEEVAEGLSQNACNRSIKSIGSGTDSDDDESHLTPEQIAHKREFEKKRKLHYNEGAALKAMMAQIDDEDME